MESEAMEGAKAAIRLLLMETREFLASEAAPKLTEADTKAHFIDPFLAALGWRGIGVVVREHYVRESQEFIDYVMFGPTRPVFAVEAKALQTSITDKHAAQLIQYCSIEGIEWAAVTNGRELHLFNTFLKPDLSAKRVLSIDLLAFANDADFDALFDDVQQLSRDQILSPSGTRAWLHRRRLDTAIRGIISNPQSSTIRQLRRELAAAEVAAPAQEIAQWFRRLLEMPIETPTPIKSTSNRPLTQATERLRLPTERGKPVERPSPERSSTPSSPVPLFAGKHRPLLPVYEQLRRSIDQRWAETDWRILRQYVAALSDGQTFLAVYPRSGRLVVGLSLPPDTVHERITDNRREFHWSRITKVVHLSSSDEVDETLLGLVDEARQTAPDLRRSNSYFGITLRDLMTAGLLKPNTPLILTSGLRDVATATLTESGAILWQGKTYRSLSDRNFAHLLGRRSLNGWTSWYADLPTGRVMLTTLREVILQKAEQPGAIATASQRD
jgi:hypothetical protein